jgi:hypothetical protein
MKHFAALLAIAVTAGCAGQSIPARPSTAALRASAQDDTARSTAPTIVLDAKSSGPVVSADVYGASLDTWYDFVQPFVDPSLHQTGIHLVRFPGGSESDVYHWENGGTLCDPNMGYITPESTFEHLMQKVAGPLAIDIAITMNYGSNRTCDGGGDPNEAGAWVAYAKSHGYRVPFWTVGNEVYGSWEYDLHARKHDPHTYAAAVRTGFYPAVKAADPSAMLGVVGDFDQPGTSKWNSIVFREAAPFDFVEIHYYPQYNVDSDSYLLGKAIDIFATSLAGVRAQMNAAGLKPTMPIYLGEYNNDAGNEGKQSVSIVNGLFVGQMLGTMMNAGVPMSTFWLAYGSCNQNGDNSSTLYGWQQFGSEALFSDGLPIPNSGCANTPKIPGGTPFPTARVMELFARTVPAGSMVRTIAVPASLRAAVRAYGFAQGNGYAVVAFNNTLTAVGITAEVKNAAARTYQGTLWTYGKAQYDFSRQNRWVGPVNQNLGSVSSHVPLTLQPYSMTVLVLK